jgi:hypothetical protein
MTYNLKLAHKAVKFAYANRTADLNLGSGASTDAQYALTALSGSTGLQATLSGGNVVLGDRVYHGFFYPMVGGNDLFTVSIFINGVALTTQRTVIKQLASTAASVNNITRSQPLFFSYVATAGDVLSVRYSKTSGAILNIYSGAIGTNLFLMEVAK